MPRLTVHMAAILQGFPPEWQITGRKTRAYRQVGNAVPPAMALVAAAAVLDAHRVWERLVASGVDPAAVSAALSRHELAVPARRRAA